MPALDYGTSCTASGSWRSLPGDRVTLGAAWGDVGSIDVTQGAQAIQGLLRDGLDIGGADGCLRAAVPNDVEPGLAGLGRRLGRRVQPLGRWCEGEGDRGGVRSAGPDEDHVRPGLR